MRDVSWKQQRQRPDVRDVKDGTLGTAADCPEYCPPAFHAKHVRYAQEPI
jgi:hypothetical protein